MASVEYYFCLNSPWSLFAAEQLLSVRSDLDFDLTVKPIEIARLFDETGGLPLKKRSPNRQKYRLQELTRWSQRLGIPINLHPAHYPCNEASADALVLSAEQEKGQGLEMAISIGRGLWCEDADIADPDFIALQAEKFGLSEIVDQSQTAAMLAQNTAELIEKGGFGVPTFIVGEQVFWGHDRIDFLIEALS
ncbi:2-hydroxychromene-2-carboxylate isomerase [Pontibacterium sp.]|uniref:2-hydroxychromene-2-carboxylate isomerase n=1 Tax=Pontibacterium sp. TaxID=2036026 RepID=UPI00356483A7